MSAAFVPIGRIVKAHGLRGEVSVKTLTDLPLDAFVGLHVWIAPPTADVRETVITDVRRGPKGPLASLSGVEDVSAAERLGGRTIMARPEDLPEDAFLEEDDPVGLEVNDVERGLLGTVTDVIVTGANDVWVVEGDRYGEILVPVIEDVLIDVDFEQGTATVRLLVGLIDEEDGR